MLASSSSILEGVRSILRPPIYLLYYDHFRDLSKEIVDEQLNECLKYLYLASLHHDLSGSFLPVTKSIDEMWHFLIIQTHDYADFCSKLPGGRFIHHQSLHFSEFSESNSRERIIKTFFAWAKYYEASFGPLTEQAAQYWVFPQFLQRYFGLSLGEIYQRKILASDSF